MRELSLITFTLTTNAGVLWDFTCLFLFLLLWLLQRSSSSGLSASPGQRGPCTAPSSQQRALWAQRRHLGLGRAQLDSRRSLCSAAPMGLEVRRAQLPRLHSRPERGNPACPQPCFRPSLPWAAELTACVSPGPAASSVPHLWVLSLSPVSVWILI